MWLVAILHLVLAGGGGDLYTEACRLLQDGRLSAGAEALRALPEVEPYRRKAELLLPILDVLMGKGAYRGGFASGRLASGALELGVAADGTFTAGLLGGEGPGPAYIPFLFGFPRPISSRWTVWIDEDARALPPTGWVRGASAGWSVEGVEFRMSLAAATMGKGPPCAASLNMEAVNRSGSTRKVGLRLTLDLADGFDDGPLLWASPLGPLSRAMDWHGDHLPPFLLSGGNTILFRGSDLHPPGRLIVCPWPLAEDSLWDFSLPPDLPLGADSAAVLFWEPGALNPGEIRRASIKLGRGDLGLDRGAPVSTLALMESLDGEAMLLVLYLENSAPGHLDRLEDIEVRMQTPPGLRLREGQNGTRSLGDLPRNGSGQLSWVVERTGEAGGRQVMAIDVGAKDTIVKRIQVPIDLPGRRDLAGRALASNGAPLAGSEVAAWMAGRGVGRSGTDGAGAYRLRNLASGTYELQGKKLLYRCPAVKRGHEAVDNAIYDLVVDSDRVEDSGAVNRARAAVGEGRDLHLTHATFRYNLLISVEWDADRGFLDNVVRGMRAASNYLHDALDGQMCFGKIAVYDNGLHWNDADLQVFAQNSVHANANVGGYTTRWEPYRPWNPAIHFGRSWNGGNWPGMFHVFPWDHQAMYRTIVHEFGHYGLALFDEYIGRVDGVWRGLAISEMCPSFMGYQYVIGGDYNSNRDTELCYHANHHAYTAQGIYRGMSCWEWVKRTHDGAYSGVPVALVSPGERGAICPGPTTDVGNELAAFVHDAQTGAFDATLGIVGPWGSDVWGIPVWTTVASEGRKIFQGSTGVNRKIRMLGVHVGDEVEAIHQGMLARMTLKERREEYELQFLPYPSGVTDYPVIISVFPERAGVEELAALTVEMETPLGIRGDPEARIRWGPVDRPLSLSSVEEGKRWCATEAVDPGSAGEGSLEVRLTTPSGDLLNLVADFRTMQLGAGGGEWHNFDGSLGLRAVSGAAKEIGPCVFSSTLAPPLELEDGRLVSRIESMQGAGGPPRFDPPASLRLVIPPEVSEEEQREVTLRRWKDGAWTIVESRPDAERRAVLADIDEGGVYGLFAPLEAR